VEGALEQLMLQPTIVKSTPDIANISDGLEGGKLPFEAVIVSSLSSVSMLVLAVDYADLFQAQSLRDLEHLRFMPLVLLAPVSLAFLRWFAANLLVAPSPSGRAIIPGHAARDTPTPVPA
jgi:hypothetical protein